jgi:hypothetical protein
MVVFRKELFTIILCKLSNTLLRVLCTTTTKFFAETTDYV